MKLNLIAAALLTIAPLSALAVHGSWSGSAAGPRLSIGKQSYPGPAISPASPLPKNASLNNIAWRISLLSPAPHGLQIKLCSVSACIELDRLTGQRAAPLPFLPGETLRFIYAVEAYGQLRPPVQVTRSQVTINYQW
ncbi:flagellar protein FlhE [Mixta intestinalis]|uniref:Flagellar protein FlhE n=1 Tax=Mixta intestinalis TaxID=1615494 RepID=A0A6P1Q4A2_9GAMM|nr:flagellar protein FlhE [Mixta intestinalis]QHM73221.1 Flagellar protein FlhE [Mixta intestinalis]